MTDTTDLIKIYITLVAAISLSVISGVMTILGYSQMFQSQFIYAVWLFIALELAKVVIAYRAKLDYLLAFEVVLIAFATIGHFGFLSDAYWRDRVKSEIHSNILSDNTYVETRKAEIQQIQDEIQHLQDSVKGFKGSFSKLKESRDNQDRIDSLRGRINTLDSEIAEHNKKLLTDRIEAVDTHNNTIKYSADTLGVSQDTFASWVIFVASVTIDPLALALVFCFSTEFKKHKQTQKEVFDLTINNFTDYIINDMDADSLVEFDNETLGKFYKTLNTRFDKKWFKFVLAYRESKINNTKLSDIDTDLLYDSFLKGINNG